MAKRKGRKVIHNRKDELGDTNALGLVIGGLALMLLGAFLGYMYFASHNVTPQTSLPIDEQTSPTVSHTNEPNQATPAPHVFDIQKVNVGDKVGTMMVKSIEPFNADYGSLSNNNFRITFTGHTKISGKYTIFDGTEPGISHKTISFTPNTQSSAILPKEVTAGNYGYAAGFDFADYDKAYTLLSPLGKTGTATIVIDNYTLVAYPSEVSNTADILQVVK